MARAGRPAAEAARTAPGAGADREAELPTRCQGGDPAKHGTEATAKGREIENAMAVGSSTAAAGQPAA